MWGTGGSGWGQLGYTYKGDVGENDVDEQGAPEAEIRAGSEDAWNCGKGEALGRGGEEGEGGREEEGIQREETREAGHEAARGPRIRSCR